MPTKSATCVLPRNIPNVLSRFGSLQPFSCVPICVTLSSLCQWPTPEVEKYLSNLCDCFREGEMATKMCKM